ncbi:hypothetical protein D3C80_1523030 [compost metagenome]
MGAGLPANTGAAGAIHRIARSHSDRAGELSKVTIQTDGSRLITPFPRGTFRRIAIILRRLANTSARKRSAQKMRPDSLFAKNFCQGFLSLSRPSHTHVFGPEPRFPAPETPSQYHDAIIASHHKTGKKSPPLAGTSSAARCPTRHCWQHDIHVPALKFAAVERRNFRSTPLAFQDDQAGTWTMHR